MKPSITLPDILDIEFLFKGDEPLLEQGQDSGIRRRDRTIYLTAESTLNSPSTKDLVCHWLIARRREYQQQQVHLPGALWREATRLTTVLVFLLSLLSGIALATSFLRYDGTTPVNVSGFFAFFVLVQLLLLFFHIAFFSYRLLRRISLPTSLLYALTARTLARLFTSLVKRSQKHLSAGKRLELQAVSGSLRQLRYNYGNLLLWPAFILLQIAGSGFNLGVLLTLLAKVSFSDIAFGWQSTLPLTDAFLAELVRWIALPWAWLMPQEWAYPSLDQIIGSKIILIEGNWRLSHEGLTSWWPFLVCGLLTYGLLPRLFLAGWGHLQLQAELSRLPFDNAACQQLRRRMLTPVVESAAAEQIAPFTPRPPVSKPKTQTPPTVLKGKGCLVLVPDELWDLGTSTDLAAQLAHLDNSSPLVPLRYGAFDQSLASLLDQVAVTLKVHDLAGIVVLHEAWQPPIREVTTLLEQLRLLIGTAPLAIALIGKPSPGTALTPVQPQDLAVWRKTTRALADPYLDLFPLVSH